MARQPVNAARDSSSASVSAKPTTAAKPRSTRAERACYSCHKRKIRCDVVKASPCSNCKVDKLEVSAYPFAYQLIAWRTLLDNSKTNILAHDVVY